MYKGETNVVDAVFVSDSPSKGHLQKRGPTAVSGWNKRWVIITDGAMAYYKARAALVGVGAQLTFFVFDRNKTIP